MLLEITQDSRCESWAVRFPRSHRLARRILSHSHAGHGPMTCDQSDSVARPRRPGRRLPRSQRRRPPLPCRRSFRSRRSSAQPTAGRPSAGRPEAARGEERGVCRFDGLAASTATTVREVGINNTEWQAGNAQRGRMNAQRGRTSERKERI